MLTHRERGTEKEMLRRGGENLREEGIKYAKKKKIGKKPKKYFDGEIFGRK